MNLRGNSGEEHPPPAQRSYRLWAAFAVLPFVDALAGFLGFPLVWYTGGHTGQQLHDAAQAARAFGLVAGLLGLVVTLGGAVPAVFWLMKRGPVTLSQLIAAGLILGNIPFVSYVFRLVWSLSLMALNGEPISRHLAPIPDLIAGTLRALAIGSTFGTLSAGVFWFVGIRGDARLTSAAESRGSG